MVIGDRGGGAPRREGAPAAPLAPDRLRPPVAGTRRATVRANLQNIPEAGGRPAGEIAASTPPEPGRRRTGRRMAPRRRATAATVRAGGRLRRQGPRPDPRAPPIRQTKTGPIPVGTGIGPVFTGLRPVAGPLMALPADAVCGRPRTAARGTVALLRGLGLFLLAGGSGRRGSAPARGAT